DDVEDAEDLISALLRAAVDGQRLTPEEIVRFCVTLVVAGSETTTFLIGNLLHAMARDPETTARLRDDRTLVNVFVEEAMRVDGPPQRLFRIATRDVEVGGKQIRKGDWVALFFGSANRDPDVFPDPGKLDIDRPNIRQQLSMGHGLHFCLGASLA
ncbi:cytochrome P450, partial [Mycolicibacter minnesotensis]|uniref:cytochrome P450 n=2 Tax=Mycobacteriaceae TaxID=1762 RepID=UPI0021F25168